MFAATCEDIRLLRPSGFLSDDMDYAVDTYNTGLTVIIDKHVPIKTRTVIVRPHTPWNNDDIRSQKRLRRQLERKWRKSGMESDILAYCHQRQLVTSIIHTAKVDYNTKQMKSSGDQRQLFQLLRSYYTLITIHGSCCANHSTRLQRFPPTFSAKIPRQFALDLLITLTLSMAPLGKRCQYMSVDCF